MPYPLSHSGIILHTRHIHHTALYPAWQEKIGPCSKNLDPFSKSSPVFGAGVNPGRQDHVPGSGFEPVLEPVTDPFKTLPETVMRLKVPETMNTVLIGPGETVDLGLRADAVGTWMFHCHILDHTMNGEDMTQGEMGGLITLIHVTDANGQR